MQQAVVSKRDIEDLVNNKEELIYFFEHLNNAYLPPSKYVTHRYLGSLLKGEKKCIRVRDITSTWTPKVSPFLTVPDLYDDILAKYPEFEEYMPHLVENQAPPRDYFFTVANSLIPNFSEQYLELLERHRAQIIPED